MTCFGSKRSRIVPVCRWTEGGGVLETTFVVGEKTDAWNEMQAWNRKWAEVIGDMTGMGDNLTKLSGEQSGAAEGNDRIAFERIRT